MAVTVVQEQNPLNAIGGMMTVGGALIPNAGLLTPLGIGLSAATGGTTDYQNTVLGKIMDNMLKNGWKNPAGGSMTKGSSSKVPSIVSNVMQTANRVTPPMSDEELARRWGGYM